MANLALFQPTYNRLFDRLFSFGPITIKECSLVVKKTEAIRYEEDRRGKSVSGMNSCPQSGDHGGNRPNWTANFCYKMLHLRGLLWKEKCGSMIVIEKYLLNNGVVTKFLQTSPPHYIEYNPTHRRESQGGKSGFFAGFW